MVTAPMAAMRAAPSVRMNSTRPCTEEHPRTLALSRAARARPGKNCPVHGYRLVNAARDRAKADASATVIGAPRSQMNAALHSSIVKWAPVTIAQSWIGPMLEVAGLIFGGGPILDSRSLNNFDLLTRRARILSPVEKAPRPTTRGAYHCDLTCLAPCPPRT